MGWEPIGTLGVRDIKKTKGEPHEGTYAGRKDIITKIGPQIIWNFTSEEGNFGVYGFTNLNRVMEQIPIGTSLRITYTGTQFLKTKFKPQGQDVHQVQVEKWAEETEKPTYEPGADYDERNPPPVKL